MTASEAIRKLLENAGDVMGNILLCVVLFQFGIKRFWPKYPFPGFKKGFFLFLTLLGVYGFIRGLITGW